MFIYDQRRYILIYMKEETEKTIYNMLRTEHAEQKEDYSPNLPNMLANEFNEWHIEQASKVLLPKSSLANILRHTLQSMPQSPNNLIIGNSSIKFSNGEIEIRTGNKEETLYKHNFNPFNPKDLGEYLIFSQRGIRKKLNEKPAQ